MAPVARTLAEFAVAATFDRLPEPVRHEGRRAFLNWVGCAVAGVDEGAVATSLAAFDAWSGPRVATVIGRPERTDPFLAAFLNSLSSSVHSFNDTHFETVAHPTSPVAAALLALAETRPVSGPAFLTALILGNEIQCRVGLMLVTPPASCGVGLSMAGLVGCIGAAVAAGSVLGLDAEAMARTLGIAANQSAGLREAHATMSSHFTPANAARAGLNAALLAQAGYGCSDTMLDGEKGFAVSFATDPVFRAATDGLGERFEILSNAYKPYPCGFVIHPVIDACLDLARAPGFDAAQVETVEIRVNPLCVKLTDRPSPRDRRQALVSCQHWAAAALVFGRAGLAAGSDAAVADPRVATMRGRIRLVADPAVGREAATAVLTRADGTRARAEVAHCRGSIGRPMTDDELDEKFFEQARPILGADRSRRVRDLCVALDREPDVGRALGPLLGPPTPVAG